MPGTTPPVPGPPAAVLSAVLVGGPAYGQRNKATFSTTGPPLLPSLMTEVVALPAYAEFDADLAVLGTLISQGWATGNVTTVTSNYTALPTDAVILANATTAAFTVTLPDATQPGFFDGQRYSVVKTDSSSNNVTITGSAGQKIDGAATITLSGANAYTAVVFDGANWWVWTGYTTVGASPSGPAGGGLSGSYPNPTVAEVGILPSGVTSGVPDTAAILAAFNSQPGSVTLAPGAFYVKTGMLDLASPPQYLRGAGIGLTTIYAVGSGDCVRMQNPTPATQGFGTISAWGGGVRDLTIDGTFAGAGACGLHFGDAEEMEFNVMVQHFNGAGSIGVLMHNLVWYTEKTHGNMVAEDCTTGFVFQVDNSMSTTASSSMAYTHLDCRAYCYPNQSGWSFLNGPDFYHGFLELRGNFYRQASGTTASAMNGVTANGFTGTFTLSASATPGFYGTNPGAGGSATVTLSDSSVCTLSWTGVSGSTLTGCTVSGANPTATFTTGGTVTGLNSASAISLAGSGGKSNHTTSISYTEIRGQMETIGATGGTLTGPKSISFGTGTVMHGKGWLRFLGGSWQQSNPAGTPGTGQLQGEFLGDGDTTLFPASGTGSNRPAIQMVGQPIIYAGGSVSEGGSGEIFSFTLASNITLPPGDATSFAGPQKRTYIITQAASGTTYSVTWASSGSPTVSSPNVAPDQNGTLPAMSQTHGAVQVFGMETADGANWQMTRNPTGGSASNIVAISGAGQAAALGNSGQWADLKHAHPRKQAAPAMLNASNPSLGTLSGTSGPWLMGLGGVTTQPLLYTPNSSGEINGTLTYAFTTASGAALVTSQPCYGPVACTATTVGASSNGLTIAQIVTAAVLYATSTTGANATGNVWCATTTGPAQFAYTSVTGGGSPSFNGVTLVQSAGATSGTVTSGTSAITGWPQNQSVATTTVGTQFGQPPALKPSGIGNNLQVTVPFLLSGLTAAQQFWFDVSLLSGINTDVASLENPSMFVEERY